MRWYKSLATTRRSATTATRTFPWAWPTPCWPCARARSRSTAPSRHSAPVQASPTEILAAVFERFDIETGLDTNKLLDAAEDIVRPLMTRVPIMDRSSVVQGKAGVYNSFLIHAERAAERYGVPAAEILEEVGRRKLVGGQEDMIIDVAVALQKERTA